jgi:thiol-disulfide isomerase/thioredoxin
MSNRYEALNTMLMPLPAAGFTHLPLSLKRITAKGTTVDIPDLPYLGAMAAFHKWEGKLTTDLSRFAGVAEFSGSGENRRLVRLLNHGSPEYVFTRFAPFKGIQIASEYTRFYIGAQREYTLKSAEPQALPEAEFEPGQVLRGRGLRFDYKGRHLDFKANPDGTDFQAQLENQVPLADAEVSRQRQAQAHDAYLETLPGLMPDIMPLYNHALAKARTEGKVVLALSTASTCPPCHQLERMFKDPAIKPIVDKHFEVLWIDCGEQETGKKFENRNGTKLCKQLGLASFPSYATIAGDGSLLERTGDAGYPGDADDDARFFKVLNAGRKLLSADELSTMQTYLNTHRTR